MPPSPEIASRERPFGRTVAWLSGATVVAALVRVWATSVNPGACYDAYLYAGHSEFLAAGDLDIAFSYLNLNVFIALLAAAIGCGFDPLVFGKVVSTTAALLTIFPLFAFVKRMYGDRVAVAACAMYAVHPAMAKLSAEPIRDPLFLMFFATALWGIRSLVDRPTAVRAVAAGLAVTAAIHTRSEGWALFVPLVGWTLVACWKRRHADQPFRAWAVQTTAAAAAAAVLPAAILLVNVTLLRGHDRWEVGRLAPLTIGLGIDLKKLHAKPAAAPTPSLPSVASETAAAMPLPAAAPVPTATPVPAVPAVERVVVTERARNADLPRRPFLHVYTLDVANTFHPLITALMLVGLVRFAHKLADPDHFVSTVTVTFVFAAVGLRLARHGEINGRYFCPVFFLAVGAAGDGLVWLVDLVRTRLAGTHWPAVGAAALTLAAVGLAADIVLWVDPNRAKAIELAERFAAELPRPIVLATSPTAGRLGNHLARARHAIDGVSFPRVYPLAGHGPPPMTAERLGADAVLIETYHAPADVAQSFLDQFAAAGYVVHDWPDEPVADRYVLMLKPVPLDNPAARVDPMTARADTPRRTYR
ncbi:MAG: glycosyltransferase family 39 protein [Planctomycetota bacterium]